MPLPTHLIWKLEVFDATGNIVASTWQNANSPLRFSGTLNSVAEIIMPAVQNLARFITPPDEPARAVYETFRKDCAEVYGLSAAEWDTLAESDPALADKWRAIAAAATATNPALN